MISPDLQCTQLGDGVLDVVEGNSEQVRLTHPAAGANLFQTTPVHLIGAEAIHDGEPVGGALIARVSWMGVEPVLERIDHGDPWEQTDDSLEVLDPSSSDLVWVLVEDIEMRCAE